LFPYLDKTKHQTAPIVPALANPLVQGLHDVRSNPPGSPILKSLCDSLSGIAAIRIQRHKEPNPMNQQVTDYLAKAGAWQAEIGERLRATVHSVLPDAEERLQYGKPHYLKNGKYAAVISIAKGKVSFMLFNASGIEPVNGFIRSMGNGERKTIDITEGQAVDYGKIGDLLRQASAGL
jgi:hypothetical protein